MTLLWRRLRDDDEGISLVEILVSILILGVALAAFASTITASLASISSDEQRVRANQTAAAQIERVRALPWTCIGLHTSDAGYRSSAPGGNPLSNRPTVALNTSACTGAAFTNRQRPTGTVTAGGITFAVRTDIVSVPDPTYTSASSDPQIKEIAVTLTWTVRGRSQEITSRSQRTPTVEEVPVTPVAPCTAGSIVDYTINPNTVTISPSGLTVEPIVVVVETCSATSSVSLFPDPLGTRNMTADSGSTRLFRHTIAAGQPNFQTRTYNWSVTTTGASGTRTQTAPIIFRQPVVEELEVVTVTQSPERICVSGSRVTYAGTTLTIDVRGVSSSTPAEVTISWTAPNGTVTATAVTGAPTGLQRFVGTIPQGTQFDDATTTTSIRALRLVDNQVVTAPYVREVIERSSLAACS